mgnify:FL=1
MQKQQQQQQQRLVSGSVKQVLSSIFTQNAKEVKTIGGQVLTAGGQLTVIGQKPAQTTSEALVVRAPVNQFALNAGRTDLVVR